MHKIIRRTAAIAVRRTAAIAVRRTAVQAATRAGALAAALAGLLSSCVAVKPYQRVYLNDKHMQLGKPDIAAFDESAQTYREGASGGGNGKASGGCGCN